jgi:hypothetical protein
MAVGRPNRTELAEPSCFIDGGSNGAAAMSGVIASKDNAAAARLIIIFIMLRLTCFAVRVSRAIFRLP